MASTMTPVVRVESLGVENFKNVVGGKVIVHDAKRSSGRSADVLGIYGQNGSGKTAIVEAMLLLKSLLSGAQLPERAADWVYAGADNVERTMSIEYGFRVENLNERTFECVYEVHLQRDGDRLSIRRESLSGKQVEPKIRTKMRPLLSSEASSADTFEPKCLYNLIDKRDPGALIDARSIKLMAHRLGISFLFSEELSGVLMKAAPDKDITHVIGALRSFGSNNLFVIDEVQAGTIFSNTLLPISFKQIDDRDRSNVQKAPGNVVLDMRQPISLDVENFENFSRLVAEINRLLEAIVPDLQIEIGEVVESKDSNGNELRRKCEVFSRRSGTSIPIRCESNGILRLISIASLFVNVYNQRQACLVIDELDAGVFEYLLGELVGVIQNGGMGQLIFTSHNLRPLETLDWRNLVFTTTNPRKRYTPLKGVKPTNNVRDVFYRNIVLGTSGTVSFYDATDRSEIDFALGDAWAQG